MSTRPSSTSFDESGDLYSNSTYSSKCDTDNESDLAVCKDKRPKLVKTSSGTFKSSWGYLLLSSKQGNKFAYCQLCTRDFSIII